MSHRVLIIEDDHDIADLVQLHLRDLDVEADIAFDGVAGWELLGAGLGLAITKRIVELHGGAIGAPKAHRAKARSLSSACPLRLPRDLLVQTERYE